MVLAEAVPLLIGWLRSRDEDVQEHAVMTLRNVTGEGHQERGYVLSLGIIEPLLNIVQLENISRIRLSCLRNIAWVMANLCRDWEAPQPVTELKKLVPSCKALIQDNDTEIQRDMLWALSYLTENDNELILLVVNANKMTKEMPTTAGHMTYIVSSHNPPSYK